MEASDIGNLPPGAGTNGATTRNPRRLRRGNQKLLPVLLALVLCFILPSNNNSNLVQALGGEKAIFDASPVVLPVDIQEDAFDNNDTDTAGITSHRQDLCGRYDLVRNRRILLRDALRGTKLNVLMQGNTGLSYTPSGGIDPVYGGYSAEVMDNLAERAGFTWRNSFGVAGSALEANMTWTEQLWWGINTFDIYFNRWDQSLERMEMGVAFVEPFYDASIILIDKREPETLYLDVFDLNSFWNWARPFETGVWILIAVTIVFSGLVYQFIEYMDDEKKNRPGAQWFYDNLYLSVLNFTLNFEYAPTSGAARIFTASVAFWAMIVTATYTANLAGFMITAHQPAPTIDSILDAVVQKIPICTYENTNSDVLIQERYPAAVRRPYGTEQEMYDALQAGECGLLADHVSGWFFKKRQSKFNPNCDLERVGDTVAGIKASFTVKADVGFKCTSLIRDVLNVHMLEMIESGDLDKMGEKSRNRLRDNECDYVPKDLSLLASDASAAAVEESGGSTRRSRHLLGTTSVSYHTMQHTQQRARKLQSSSSGSESGVSSEGESSLSVEDMAGTFLLHTGLMVLSVCVSICTPCWTRWKVKRGWEQPVPVTIGLSRMTSYARRQPVSNHIPPGGKGVEDLFLDGYHDEETSSSEKGSSRRRHRSIAAHPEQSPASQESVEIQLKRFEARQEKKLEEHMAKVESMLSNMKKHDKNFQKVVLSKLGVQRPSEIKVQHREVIPETHLFV